jgi:hypothetical protein
MNPPRATMRLQFNSDFTFANARSHISYLGSLTPDGHCLARTRARRNHWVFCPAAMRL